MSETPYNDLQFSAFQHLIMLRAKYFGISYNSLTSKSRYDFLRIYNLLRSSRKKSNCYVLNEKGSMYLRYRRKDSFRFWLPTTISILALFAGYDVYKVPAVERLLQELTRLLRSILESLDAVL